MGYQEYVFKLNDGESFQQPKILREVHNFIDEHTHKQVNWSRIVLTQQIGLIEAGEYIYVTGCRYLGKNFIDKLETLLNQSNSSNRIENVINGEEDIALLKNIFYYGESEYGKLIGKRTGQDEYFSRRINDYFNDMHVVVTSGCSSNNVKCTLFEFSSVISVYAVVNKDDNNYSINVISGDVIKCGEWLDLDLDELEHFKNIIENGLNQKNKNKEKSNER